MGVSLKNALMNKKKLDLLYFRFHAILAITISNLFHQTGVGDGVLLLRGLALRARIGPEQRRGS